MLDDDVVGKAGEGLTRVGKARGSSGGGGVTAWGRPRGMRGVGRHVGLVARAACCVDTDWWHSPGFSRRCSPASRFAADSAMAPTCSAIGFA